MLDLARRNQGWGAQKRRGIGNLSGAEGPRPPAADQDADEESVKFCAQAGGIAAHTCHP